MRHASPRPAAVTPVPLNAFQQLSKYQFNAISDTTHVTNEGKFQHFRHKVDICSASGNDAQISTTVLAQPIMLSGLLFEVFNVRGILAKC